MMPTVNPRGDVLLTEYISPRLSLLRAGDVVVATKPNDGTVTVVKRIRGMPNDVIWVRRCGSPRAEKISVPAGHVWLEGDNPLQSTDSREYGPVPLKLVKGRILARFWPPGQACVMRTRVVDHTEAERAVADASMQANACCEEERAGSREHARTPGGMTVTSRPISQTSAQAGPPAPRLPTRTE
jgi:signal peptidase I